MKINAKAFSDNRAWEGGGERDGQNNQKLLANLFTHLPRFVY